MRGNQLIITPDTANCYRATITALRTLPKERGVVFHTYTPPRERSVRLLIKHLGRNMPLEDVVEELLACGIEGASVTQLRSNHRDADSSRDRPLTPHFLVTIGRGPMVQKLRSVEVLCDLTVKVETYNTPKGPLQCRQCQRFGHTKRKCGHTPRCVACGAEHASGSCVTGKDEVRCCNCAENHTANYRGCRRFKEARQQLSQRGPAKKTGRPHPRPTPE